MALASIEDIRDLLDWPDVRRLDRPEYGMTYLRVVSRRRSLPPIEFAFGGDLDSLVSFGFGEWHAHPSLDDALVAADDLIRHRKCILEERDRGNGRYRGSALVGPRDLLGMIGRGAVFRRVFFGEEPVEERVDLSLYVEADHGMLVLRTEAKALERVCRQSGAPVPEWLQRANQ